MDVRVTEIKIGFISGSVNQLAKWHLPVNLKGLSYFTET
jgi:hypothetical protein